MFVDRIDKIIEELACRKEEYLEVYDVFMEQCRETTDSHRISHCETKNILDKGKSDMINLKNDLRFENIKRKRLYMEGVLPSDDLIQEVIREQWDDLREKQHFSKNFCQGWSGIMTSIDDNLSQINAYRNIAKSCKMNGQWMSI